VVPWRLWLWITPRGQLDAAAAGAEVVELELEPLEDDLSDDEDDELVVDSELEPLDEVDELVAALLAESRLSLR
jgi:hypothetical protein